MQTKKWLLTNLPWLFFALGIIMLLSGYLIESYYPRELILINGEPAPLHYPFSDRVVRIIGSVLQSGGSAILGAGIFAAVLKSFQFTGLFQEELGKVIFSDEYLGKQDPGYLSRQWERLMHALHTKNFPAIKDKITKAILDTILHPGEEYYFESFKFYFDNVKLEKENGIEYLSYNLTTSAKIIPVDTKGTFSFINKFYAVLDANSYRKVTSFIIDGKEIDPGLYNNANADGKNYTEYAIELNGGTRHSFLKKEERKFNFNLPTNEQHLFELSRMANGLYLDFRYDEKILNASFISKTIGEFNPLKNGEGCFVREYDGVAFKSHGFCVVLSKR